MTSNRPYLIRAFYEWIADNNLTPYIVVNAEFPVTSVPMQYVEDGKIILNVSATAAQGLLMSNDAIEFNARFSGVPMHVYAPVAAIVAIYARENGQGMVFSEEENDGDGNDPGSTPTPQGKSKPGKPKLTVVK